MRSSKTLSLFLLLFALGLLAGCGGGGGGGGDGGDPPPAPFTGNVVALTVNGSTCSPATSANYPNKPCVSITLCDSVGGNCQTINDILLDTGDYGVRIFQQVLSGPLLAALNANPVQAGGQPLYECVEYGDGATVWGPVRQASLILGNEPAVQLPVHVTGSTDGNPAIVCAGSPRLLSPGPDPNSQAQYNGTLGVGLRAQDCRSACTSIVQNGFYYTCPGGVCTGTIVPLSSQVQNPVARLPVDNNGVIVALPSVPSTGAPANSVSGSLILGIGTRSNNTPSGVTPYGASSSGFLTTAFNGSTYPRGFLDSGSNGIFFPNFGIPILGSFYAPASALNFSATNTGASNAPNQSVVNFQVESVATLSATGNMVFSNLAAPIPDNISFDWGLPFFLGRNVYVGIEGRTSPGLAVGPFWAY